ncbi:VanZ family protein [Pseudomonas stutzeri]|uniref:VanZ family protein n=1 Tax=Stutzerimonas stutzeri TaxID=316 RepID=A0A2N8S607_STUST|nr:VanZ family protein [Stutzerimonas stutzeri]MCQ4297040.1 VanZ family protein [Stutzerimonas stutzeri]PNF82051.1 VanZ family protein [Stutzerimonas stutzeri]
MPYLRVLPFLIVLAVVLFNGLKPEPVPQLFNQQDKLHHLLGFAALVFTLRLGFPRIPFIWGLCLTVAAALLIELAQGLLPHRTASRWDMLANVLGVLLGWGCSMLAHGWWRQRLGEPLPE